METHTMSDMTLVYWRSGNLWLGRLFEHPGILSQGKTVEELEKNIREAYRRVALKDVPEKYYTTEISI